MDFPHDLNPQQLEGVTYTQGPLLILAGAGSGKTRVITYRIAYLIGQQGVSPEQILAVTFTNKAAEEMKNRVLALLGDRTRGVWISTFHSACVRILRREIQSLGYGQDFAILDAADQLRLVKECARELNINEELYDPKEMARRISRLKNRLISPQAYAREAQGFGIEDKVGRVYPHYQGLLKKYNSLDFDDLLMMTVYLFEGHSEVLHRYQKRFRHILIDEYQDTNPAQYRLVKLLGEHGNVCVVGDDDQGIYGFRGADLGNILRFEKDYPQARVIRLEQNYRSTQNILDAAGTVVEKNRKRKAKRLWTQNPKGSHIYLCQVTDEEAEARYISKTIKEMMVHGKRNYTDFAVLYRTHAQSRALEEGLRDTGIPYRIVGGLRFYERREIKDLLAYLKVIAYPEDDLSLKRILNVPPRGIGAATLEKLEGYAKARGLALFQALADSDCTGPDRTELTPAQKRGLVNLASLLDEIKRLAATVSLTELLQTILKKTGYEQMLEQEAAEGASGEESRSRIENIQELFSAVRIFEERLAAQPGLSEGLAMPGPVAMERRNGYPARGVGASAPRSKTYSRKTPLRGMLDSASEVGPPHLISAFLDHVTLVTDSDQETDGLTGGKGAVLMMTLHSAKGLEFPVVFMVGMEEGLFPHQSALTDPEEMEEERRLCYVGMTRTGEILYLVHAEKRRLYGSVQYNSPSRFIGEIPVELIKEVVWSDRSERSADRQPTSVIAPPLAYDSPLPQETGLFRKGTQVKHPAWGIGRVQEAEGQGEDQRVVVHFKTVGPKKLAVKFARLELI
jgi:DNA helicase-2/ATP-dependent DNA helicase PcrA